MKCCICGKEIDERDSNDPFPLKTEGRCCSECNKQVIHARLIQFLDRVHGTSQA